MHGLAIGADAAIVNYYGRGDTLGGHKDDVENDLTQPLVSISIGCSAVFLLGGLCTLIAKMVSGPTCAARILPVPE